MMSRISLILISILVLSTHSLPIDDNTFNQTDLATFATSLFSSFNLSAPNDIIYCFQSNTKAPGTFYDLLLTNYEFVQQYYAGENFTKVFSEMVSDQMNLKDEFKCVNESYDWEQLTQALGTKPGLLNFSNILYYYQCGQPGAFLNASTPIQQAAEQDDYETAGEAFGDMLKNAYSYFVDNSTQEMTQLYGFVLGITASSGIAYNQDFMNCINSSSALSVWNYFNFFSYWSKATAYSTRPTVTTAAYFAGVGGGFYDGFLEFLTCINATTVATDFENKYKYSFNPYDVNFQKKLAFYLANDPNGFLNDMQGLYAWYWTPLGKDEYDFGQNLAQVFQHITWGYNADRELNQY